MSRILERLLELRLHLEHLQALRPRLRNTEDLRQDISLRNDVLFSLLTVCQMVIDIAGELCGRNHLRFEDYTDAVRSLARLPEFSDDVVSGLVPLPGFRRAMLHEYLSLDLDRVVEALGNLEPVEQFLDIVRDLVAEDSDT